jgi:hypothetical protein
MIHRFTHLIELLNTNKPCSIVRIGNVEATALLQKEGIYSQMKTNAGFFGEKEDFKKWKSEYTKAIMNADCNLKVITCSSFFVTDDIQTQLNIFLPTLPYMEDVGFWITLINNLKTSKIGFVSYFKKDMEKQLNKINAIHQKCILSTNFDEWRIIKSENTIEGNEPYDKTFFEVYDDLLQRCLAEDRDIYFISCGCYGLLLCNDLKKKGKQAIYVGGILQLIFGIMGKRWLDRPVITQHINKNWIYPSIIPVNGKNVEGWCYGSINDKTPMEDLKAQKA